MDLGASRQPRQRAQQTGRDDRSEARPRSDGERSVESATGATRESDKRPELVDATRYDLDRLERAIRRLVAQQQALARENGALRDRLQARDAEVERLESELESARGRRERALERVDDLIGELDRLDALLDVSMAEWAPGADGAATKEDTPSGPPS